MSCAAELLEQGKITVTEMAFHCGYETVEAFSKAFKRMFRISPSQCLKCVTELSKFEPITINVQIQGGFSMKRNLVPNVQKFDWSDTRRKNEFVNSVVSALQALGE